MRLKVISTLLALINFINKQTNKKSNDEGIGYVRRREQKIIIITFCILFAAGDKLYSSCKINKLFSM